jgi:hypothetical protein
MLVVASEGASELIQSTGGRLYVWIRRGRCCGNATLRASTAAPRSRRFRRVEARAPFELFLPAGLTRFPDELHVEARRFPTRVEAYWNGCAWIV